MAARVLSTGRTAYQCMIRYQQNLNPKLLKNKWTPEEDALLVAMIDQCRVGEYIPWTQVTIKLKFLWFQ